MNMALICMGRLKEKYWRDAANEYEKRLSRFGKFEEIELPDLPNRRTVRPLLRRRSAKKRAKRFCRRCARTIS